MPQRGGRPGRRSRRPRRRRRTRTRSRRESRPAASPRGGQGGARGRSARHRALRGSLGARGPSRPPAARRRAPAPDRRCSRLSPGGGREVERDVVADAHGQHARAGVEPDYVVDQLVLRERVGGRQRRVPTEIHLDGGRELPQVPVAVRAWTRERRLGEVQLCRDALHPGCVRPPLDDADAGRVSGERPIGEGVHDPDSHERPNLPRAHALCAASCSPGRDSEQALLARSRRMWSVSTARSRLARAGRSGRGCRRRACRGGGRRAP
jgi:hypothetical protein